MTKIGVLLVQEDNGILGSIVRDALLADPELDLVGELTEIGDTSAAVQRTGSRAVVWIVADARRSVTPAELLVRHPALTLLAVERDGREGYLWRMLPRRKAMGELSRQKLISALHAQP